MKKKSQKTSFFVIWRANASSKHLISVFVVVQHNKINIATMVNWIEVTGELLLFFLVFAMSATVDISCFKEQVRNRNAILVGCFLQFFVLPFLGFMVVNILSLEKVIGIMLLVVTSSPGGSYSNWWCSLFNADLALSVTMTAISSLLSTIFLPLNLLLYTRYAYEDDVIQNLDWTSLFIALMIVITAITLGLVCSWNIHSHKFNLMANHLGNVTGIALVIFSAVMTNSGGEDTRIWERDWKFYVGVSAPCLLALLVSNILTTLIKLKKPERVTVSIEGCYQNVGIATSVALTMFQDDELNEAMGVPFFYGTVEAILVGCYCLGAWKAGWTKAPRDAPLWKVIATSYEVLEAERKELDQIEVKISDSDDTPQRPTEHVSEHGNILTTYFFMADNSKKTTDSNKMEPKEPSGYDVTDVNDEIV